MTFAVEPRQPSLTPLSFALFCTRAKTIPNPVTSLRTLCAFTRDGTTSVHFHFGTRRHRAAPSFCQALNFRLPTFDSLLAPVELCAIARAPRHESENTESAAVSSLESALTDELRLSSGFRRTDPPATPLESALTETLSASPLESALAKKQGWGGRLEPHKFPVWPALQHLGGNSPSFAALRSLPRYFVTSLLPCVPEWPLVYGEPSFSFALRMPYSSQPASM